ncbi:MAG: sigma-70 family RNA polymerase sigma factor [Oscillospiraceae bacterium]|nr:sigma-70 family RNA polymerase sigma factor [Oscillospiraceae bacterium]
MTKTDEALLLLYEQRNDKAIRETEKHYKKLCMSAAMQITESREDAEECMNDALLRMWNAIPPAKPQNLGAYLLKTVRNLAYNLREKHSAMRRGSGQLPLALDELAESLAAKHDTEAQVADSLALREALNRFLGSLSADQRTIFVLRYWAALEISEIAARMDCSQGKVKMTLTRTKQKLRQYLEKEELL